MKVILKKTRFLALAGSLCVALLTAPMHANAEEVFTQEQKKEIEKLFKDYISDNPELILLSVRKYQEEQERKMMQSAQDNLKEYKEFFADKSLPMAGNPDGDVTVVEFFDFNCGWCKKAFDDVQKIIAEDSNARVVFMDLPILSPASEKMTKIALAAHKQGKYFEMHKALMDYRGSQNDAAFFKLAADLGLDMDKLKADMDSADVQAAIAKATAIAQALGIRGTPGFVVGDKVYPGYIGIEKLRNAVKQARTGEAKN